MPGGDRTGPQGRGPGSGKGRGPCGKGNKQARVLRENVEGRKINIEYDQRAGGGQRMRQGQGKGRGLGEGRNREL